MSQKGLVLRYPDFLNFRIGLDYVLDDEGFVKSYPVGSMAPLGVSCIVPRKKDYNEYLDDRLPKGSSLPEGLELCHGYLFYLCLPGEEEVKTAQELYATDDILYPCWIDGKPSRWTLYTFIQKVKNIPRWVIPLSFRWLHDFLPNEKDWISVSHSLMLHVYRVMSHWFNKCGTIQDQVETKDILVWIADQHPTFDTLVKYYIRRARYVLYVVQNLDSTNPEIVMALEKIREPLETVLDGYDWELIHGFSTNTTNTSEKKGT